jgi:hypothetical protein
VPAAALSSCRHVVTVLDLHEKLPTLEPNCVWFFCDGFGRSCPCTVRRLDCKGDRLAEIELRLVTAQAAHRGVARPSQPLIATMEIRILVAKALADATVNASAISGQHDLLFSPSMPPGATSGSEVDYREFKQ